MKKTKGWHDDGSYHTSQRFDRFPSGIGGYADPARLPAELVAGNRLAALQAMAQQKNLSASALAVAWMVNLHRCPGFPRVIPLFGSSKAAHLVGNLQGAELVLTGEEMEILNRA